MILKREEITTEKNHQNTDVAAYYQTPTDSEQTDKHHEKRQEAWDGVAIPAESIRSLSTSCKNV